MVEWPDDCKDFVDNTTIEEYVHNLETNREWRENNVAVEALAKALH